MKHIVLGRGNLGHDLNAVLDDGSNEVLFAGWRYDGLESVKDLRAYYSRPDMIWCAIGSGSVEEAKRDFRATLSRNVHLPLELCDAFPDSKIVFFSSDYVTDEPLQSLYAYSKHWLEEMIAFRDEPERLSVISVGSLYGKHRPERTFPGKLRARYPQPTRVSLPVNFVTPTPTAWLARTLVDKTDVLFKESSRGAIRVSPAGACSTAEWGSEILGPSYDILTCGVDSERPLGPGLTHFQIVGPHWLELWKEHAL